MKTIQKVLSATALILTAALRLNAQGFIVPNGVTISPINTIIVRQNPASSDYTGFSLDFRMADTFLFNPFLDEGVRTFLVSLNQPVSLQPILADSYTELRPSNTYVFANGSPFYVGLYTGYMPFDPQGHYTGIYTSPLFGWAELVNNQGVIQLLDSALEYGGGGIFAGTQTIIPIPEPSTFGLFGLGALLLGWRFRHKRT